MRFVILRWPAGGVVARCGRTISKRFCLIVFAGLASYFPPQICGKNITTSGRCDYESEGQRRSIKIDVIGGLTAGLVILYVGVSNGRQRKEEQKFKN